VLGMDMGEEIGNGSVRWYYEGERVERREGANQDGRCGHASGGNCLQSPRPLRELTSNCIGHFQIRRGSLNRRLELGIHILNTRSVIIVLGISVFVIFVPLYRALVIVNAVLDTW
jgi:hypothetical protein